MICLLKPFFRVTSLSIGLLLVAVFFLMTGTAQAAAGLNTSTQQGFDTGHATCGAFNLKTNTLMPQCGFKKATKIGRANTKCPSGTFADIGTGGCYTCPSGFQRTAFPVTEAKACSKKIGAQYKYATRKGGHKSCPSGTFKDPINGGECWKCPAGFGRTMAAVNEWNACGKAFEKARKAEFVDRVCEEGQIPDLNGSCYTCPEGYRRTAAAVTGHNACFRDEEYKTATEEGVSQCKPGEIFDLIGGGTCWTCPEGYLRSPFAVDKAQACENPEMDWEAVKRTGNGLFGLPGGHELAAKLIYDRKRIEKGITAVTQAQSELTEEVISKNTWGLIKLAPEKSEFLSAMAFGEVVDLIKNGTKVKSEKDLLSYFATYIQDTRKITAKEISLAHKSYVRGIEARAGNMHSSRSMSAAYNFGVTPPNYQIIVSDVTALLPTGVMMMSVGGVTLAHFTSPVLAKLIEKSAIAMFPFRFREAASAAAQVGRNTAAAAAGTTSSGLGAVLIPFAIVTAYSIMFSIAMDQVIDQEKAEAQINDALEMAKQPVILSRLAKTKEGRDELLTNWALMTQELIKPVPAIWNKLTALKDAANIPSVELVGEKVIVEPHEKIVVEATKAPITTTTSNNRGPLPSNKWRQINGEAFDVAVGSDGTVYVVGVGKVNKGHNIYKRSKGASSWTPIPTKTGAFRIAVEGTTPWIIGPEGKTYRLAANGKDWDAISGPPAIDIGASARGVWTLSVSGLANRHIGNGRWARFKGGLSEQDIYPKGNPQTPYQSYIETVPTSGASRIAVDEAGDVWLVDAQGRIYIKDGSKWHKFNGQAVDIAIDKPMRPRVIGSDGKIYGFINKRTWTRMSDNAMSVAIAVGGDDDLWSLSYDRRIFQYK